MTLTRVMKNIFSGKARARDHAVDFDLDYDKAYADARLNDSINRLCDTIDAALSKIHARPPRYRNGRKHHRVP